MFRLVSAALALGLLATPAAAQQQQQQQLENVTKTQNGDWALECGSPQGSTARVCLMTQDLKNPKDGNSVMRVALIKPAKGPDALLRVVAPLGVWLRPGVQLSVDGGAKQELAFDFCFREGCIAQIPLSAGLINQMKRGSSGKVVIQDIRRRSVDLTLSLQGFTKSFDGM